jgi:hypothetical protein
MRHRLAPALAAVVTAALAPAAIPAGPDLGTTVSLAAGKVVYTAEASGNRTTLAVRPRPGGEVLRKRTLPGRWGIPLLTFNGETGGLSHDGRLLVLSTKRFGQPLRARSAFVVVDTRRLAVTRRIDLPGHFAYDVLSPNGRILYLIEHFSPSEILRYRVRAYDLKRGRLLPGAIVDKREPDEPMSGIPSARISSPDGRKVFTLYVNQEHPFVHLLDTVSRAAFCIDLPHETDLRALETATLRLTRGGRTLTIHGTAGMGAHHVVDVKTLRVT